MLRFGVIAGILILAIVVKFIGDLQPLHIKTDITELPPGVQEWHKKGIPSSPPFSFFFLFLSTNFGGYIPIFAYQVVYDR